MAYFTSLGWFLALPIAAGVICGRYLDDRFDTGNFWTLSLLGLGIILAVVEGYLAARFALRRDHGR